ncbi:hypothetical protein ACFQZ4_53475 [Catellatospora coxensis]|uniref:Uncharacterized protein n=1 Tax=Catellatospora coxensis TaxID=310354 RepID=A0A8J3KZG7_9ACTN|nr:hypothetical protein [Catellatospora coxensis]GIG11603.1 hypothetical protein Cco03nite_83030 [Catellatospora coxensis]
MPGEALHDAGREGAIRAKRWLDSTTRVSQSWLNTDPGAAKKLTFNWPSSGTEFSFDLGGVLKGGEFANSMFMAEVKNYNTPSGLGPMYREYLAKCYIAAKLNNAITDHFMWITWHPFLVDSWTQLCTPDLIRKGITEQRNRILGDGSSEEDAKAWIDDDLCGGVADKLWVLVLSQKQEKLVITDEDRAIILYHETRGGRP